MAKKVNDYLKSGSYINSDIVEHAGRMEVWLSRLLTQVRGSPIIKVPVTIALPQHLRVSIWAKAMNGRAHVMIDSDMAEHGTMTYKTAAKVGARQSQGRGRPGWAGVGRGRPGTPGRPAPHRLSDRPRPLPGLPGDTGPSPPQ